MRVVCASSLLYNSTTTARSAAHTCSACSGVAAWPDPIAQTGSEATTRPLAASTPSSAARNCATGTALGPCCSRSSVVSPMQSTGTTPCRWAACTFAPTTASDSPCRVADDSVATAERREKRSRYFACERTGAVLRDILTAVPELEVISGDKGLHRTKVCKRREHRNLNRGVVVL